eukprot:gb/GECG01002325.1/.p1 GENE.gb/GECG01002325.1/~~gb/GECG01002325.1/.p1  ORF type:complete len:1267 (+),score=165.20 gb/GECG01002325.1/:1-3801(+)
MRERAALRAPLTGLRYIILGCIIACTEIAQGSPLAPELSATDGAQDDPGNTDDDNGGGGNKKSSSGSPDQDDSEVTMDGFLSSLYVNIVIFVLLMTLLTMLRRWMPEFFQPRMYSVDDKGTVFRLSSSQKNSDRYESSLNRSNAATNVIARNDGQGPPPIPEKWCGFYWMYFIWKIPLSTVLNKVGVDAYIFLRFVQKAGQLFGIVCTILGCGIILPINVIFGEAHEEEFEKLSLSNIAEGQRILWVHAISVWVFTFAVFAILLELGREFAVLRHRYLRYNMYHRTTDNKRRNSTSDGKKRRKSADEGTSKQTGITSSLGGVRMSARTGNHVSRSEGLAHERPSHLTQLSRKLPPWVKEEDESLEAPFIRNPRPYSIMVENLPSWVNCDAQLYFFFDYLFPGEVYCASLVSFADKADALFEERNTVLRSLEQTEHLEKKAGDKKIEPAFKRNVSTSEETKDSDTVALRVKGPRGEGETAREKSSITMVLCPPGTQWFIDWFCCGPFYPTLCCGCYKRICRCCDDQGRHEEEALELLGDEFEKDDDSSEDEGETNYRPKGRSKESGILSRRQQGCCHQANRVRAMLYLERSLRVTTQKLERYRQRAWKQVRRRISEEFEASMEDETSSGAVSSEGVFASPRTSDDDIERDTEMPVRRSRRRSATPDQKREKKPSSGNGFGSKITQAGKNVYDRVAFTTEVLTGIEWRNKLTEGDDSRGFRPSSTGFVTFRTMTAVSEAVRMTLVPERAVFDPALAPESKAESHIKDWTDNEAIQLAKSVTSHIFSPLQALGEVVDIGRHRSVEARRAPGPEDIHWSHVTVKEQLRQSRQWTTFWLTILLQFLYTVFVSAVSSLVTLENLTKLWPALGEFAEQHPFVRGLISGFLPTLIIESILALVPFLMEWFGYLEYMPTYSQIAISASCKYFMFKAWQLMFVFLISGTVIDTFEFILHDPQRIVTMLGKSLPSLSAFYINLLMLRTLSMLPLLMLRPFWVILHYLQFRPSLLSSPRYISPVDETQKEDSGTAPMLQAPRNAAAAPAEQTLQEKGGNKRSKRTWQLWDMTRREYWENILLCGGDFYYIYHFTNALIAFLMGITYSSINPIIAPVAACFFWHASFAWKYMILYVHHKSWETGGLIWPKMARRVNVSLVVYQLTMMGILGLKQSPSTAAVLPLLFITWFFDRFLQKWLEKPAMSLSKEECRQIDDSYPSSWYAGMTEPVFRSLKELKETPMPDKARRMCSNSAYVRPSLDPNNDWSAHSISTKNVLYY